MPRRVTLVTISVLLAGLATARAEVPLGAITGTFGGAERSWQTRLDGPEGGPGSTSVDRFATLHAASLDGYPADDGGGDRLGVLSLRLSVAPGGRRVLAARVLYYPDSFGAFYVSPPGPEGVHVALDRYVAPGEIAGRLTTTLCWQAGALSPRDTSRCDDLDIRFESGLPLAE